MARRPQRSGNLPAETTSLVGRGSELAQARRKLTSARLLTLVGPGGVGKTRLAVRLATDLARGFPDGGWLVELAELRDPALVGRAVLSSLDLRDQTATEPAALLRSHLRDKQLLLVLDNCEHLLEPAARLAADLLTAAPGLRVIATSREPLSVAGEHVLPVPPLTLPPPDAGESLTSVRHAEAVVLFVERAAAASGTFELTPANAATVVGLCRRLDGLPLALELAAVRTRTLSTEEIHRRLSSRFDLLTGGSRAALPRHQTLRTAVQWSYDLLTPGEQAMLSRLGVFAGRFLLPDVEGVCCSDDLPADQALDLLSSLVDKSLVIKHDVGTSAAYRLHETLREYARLELQRTGQEAAVERRCTAYYAKQCQRFAFEGRYRLLDWLDWIELEVDNVRAVLQRCTAQGNYPLALDLATWLIYYWVTRGTTEGVAWLDDLLAHDAQPTGHPWAYFVRGFLAVQQNDPAAGRPALDRGLAAARAAGPPGLLAQLAAMASIAATLADDADPARRLLEEASANAAEDGDPGAALMVRQARAMNGFLVGDLGAVRSAAAEGAQLSRDSGDLYSLDMMLMHQGFGALMARNLREAEQRFTEGLRIAQRLDDRLAQCYHLGGLSCCAAGTGRPQLAAQLFGAVETLRVQVGATINPGLARALEHATTAATRTLGASRLAAEVKVGRQLSREAALRLALREPPAPQAQGASSAQEGVEGLRPREAEVARLITDGLSNKEIGERLFISERTAETHVRNIMNKLGFSSRTQIAGWIAASRPSPSCRSR